MASSTTITKVERGLAGVDDISRAMSISTVCQNQVLKGLCQIQAEIYGPFIMTSCFIAWRLKGRRRPRIRYIVDR